jgi:hypothetical protein
MNTLFKWNNGGETVFVTGTFTLWKNHIALQKVGSEFSTIIVINIKKYLKKIK